MLMFLSRAIHIFHAAQPVAVTVYLEEENLNKYDVVTVCSADDFAPGCAEGKKQDGVM